MTCFEEMSPNPFHIIIRRMGLCKTSCNYKISSEFIKLSVRYQIYVYKYNLYISHIEYSPDYHKISSFQLLL